MPDSQYPRGLPSHLPSNPHHHYALEAHLKIVSPNKKACRSVVRQAFQNGVLS
jgi:hypothetical protein